MYSKASSSSLLHFIKAALQALYSSLILLSASFAENKCSITEFIQFLYFLPMLQLFTSFVITSNSSQHVQLFTCSWIMNFDIISIKKWYRCYLFLEFMYDPWKLFDLTSQILETFLNLCMILLHLNILSFSVWLTFSCLSQASRIVPLHWKRSDATILAWYHSSYKSIVVKKTYINTLGAVKCSGTKGSLFWHKSSVSNSGSQKPDIFIPRTTFTPLVH